MTKTNGLTILELLSKAAMRPGSGVNRLFRNAVIGSHPWSGATFAPNSQPQQERAHQDQQQPSSLSVLNKLHKLLKTEHKAHKKIISQTVFFLYF